MYKLKEKLKNKKRILRNIADFLIVTIPIVYFLKNFESTSSEVKFFQVLVAALVIVLIENNNKKVRFYDLAIILIIIFLYIELFSINFKSASNVSINVSYSNYNNSEVVSTIRFIVMNILFAFAYKIVAGKKND